MNEIPIRNVAIVAHVDHGKTTLVDQLLRAGGALRANQAAPERAMDSMDLEREKGITIRAKNTAVHWNGFTINVVDTPGHADFGGEVERVMKMVDGVLLVVDAAEGPQAQTRFVVRKALAHHLAPIVVINKIDRDHSDPRRVHDAVLELLLELEASEQQFDAPFLYGSARDGYFMNHPDDERVGMDPLFAAIVRHVPAPRVQENAPFRMLVSNIDWDDYVGRIAIGRIESGEAQKGDDLHLLRRDGSRTRAKITRVTEYAGLTTRDAGTAQAGNIVGIAGFEDVDIGETLAAAEDASPLPFVEIDPPTVEMEFSVNDSPGAGQDGKFVTSRQLRARLFRERKTNISFDVSDSDRAGTYRVRARGAMQISVLVETMRREGFEVLLSRPTVVTRTVEGRTHEPYETLYVETPADLTGTVMRYLGARRARIEKLTPNPHGTAALIEATIPTRGLIGLEFDLANVTGGRAVLSHLFKEYAPHCGEIITRNTGTLVSTDTGTAMSYALDSLQDRGKLFISPGEPVYQGQIVGENPRADDLPVNPVKEKKLTNHRSSGDGKGIQLSPPLRLSLERAIEYIAGDELVEATPRALRLRKRFLCPHERKRQQRSMEDALAS